MVRSEIVRTNSRVEVRLLDDEPSESGCAVLEKEDQGVINKIAALVERVGENIREIIALLG